MKTLSHSMDRRQFLHTVAMAGAGAAAHSFLRAQATDSPVKLKLGYDNFAVRAMKWKAPQLIEHAARLKVDTLFITDFGPFENFEDGYLRDLRQRASDQGIEIWLGSWSICPTSKSFKKDWGTAEEHLRLGLRMARALGSPVLRVILGSGADRLSEGGIKARIADTVKVCKACRSQALDMGVKIAVENHAGDMQSWELVQLIEDAGKDYVGANLDSGNATWTLEDPVENLEILGPYTICTSLRDSAVWETSTGATIQWTAMGDGVVDFQAFFRRFRELCPKVPVHIETISGFPREVNYLKPDFWKGYPEARAKDLAKFITLAKRGRPIPPHRSPDAQAEQAYQREELEKSLEYCQRTLGLGLKA